jgi:hypothetical protein
MTLLSIVQNVSDETGLGEPPTIVIGNQDTYVKKCLALLNKVGKKLISGFDWQVIQKEQQFTTDASGEYPRTSIFTDNDFLRYVNTTEWDKSNYKKLKYVTPQEWQFIQNSVPGYDGYYKYFRELQNKVLLYPDDTAGETLVLEYISKNWIIAADSTAKATFTSDDDTTVFDDYFLELGLKYELKAGDGLPSVVEYQEFEEEKKKLQGQETFRRDIEPPYAPYLGYNSKYPPPTIIT